MTKFIYERYRLLDAFRGVAILWIVYFHALSDVREYYGVVLNYIISKGHLGVQIFFVISGYGIAASTLSRKNPKPFSFLHSRLQRIYSTYWWSLLFAVFIIPFTASLILMIRYHRFDFNIIDYTTMEWFQIITLTKVFTSTNWRLDIPFSHLNGALWFIAIIVQIYIFIFFCLYRKNYEKILFFSFLISLLSYIPNVKSLIPKGLFVLFFPQFYIGILVYQILHSKLNTSISTLLIFLIFLISFGAAIYCAFVRNGFLGLAFSFFIGSIFLLLYKYDDYLNEFFLVKFFSLLGLFSYSLYLLHNPLRRFIGIFARNLSPFKVFIGIPLILVPGIIFLSFIWYLFFEKMSDQKRIISKFFTPITVFHSGLSDVKMILQKSKKANSTDAESCSDD